MGSDYEAQRAREMAQRRAQADEFAAVAGDVARALGGTYQRHNDDDGFCWNGGRGNISIAGDVPVLLYVSRTIPTGKGPRFVASVVLPRDRSGSYIRLSDVVRELPDGRKSSDISLEVTADLAKGADKIAADLRRRLLPDGTMATAAVLRVVDQRSAFADGVMALAREFAPLLDASDHLAYQTRHNANPSSVSLPIRSSAFRSSGQVEIHGPDSVSIKVSGTAAKARAILAALAQMAKGGA